jgi:tetratricopeptide (TPR) repeat protein
MSLPQAGAQGSAQNPSVNLQAILAFAFGVIFCGILAYAGLRSTPITDPGQFFLLRVLAALSASGVASVIPGMLNLQIGQGQLFAVRGAGALAVFALIFLVNPPELIRGPTEALRAAMEGNFSQGLDDDAQRQAETVLKSSPTDAQALNILGGIAFYRGDYQKAVEHFRGAYKSAPKDRIVTSNYANALVEVGALDESIKLFNTLDDGSIDHNFTLGRAYLYNGDYKNAHSLLSQVAASYWHGAGKILDACALLGLSGANTDTEAKSRLDKQARDEFRQGYETDRAYWDGIYSGTKDKHLTYTALLEVSRPLYEKIRTH